MNAVKIVLAALAALIVLGGMGMAADSTTASTVSLNVPSFISVSVDSNVPLTNDYVTHTATGTDTMKISSTEGYYVQGAAPKLTTGSATLAAGLYVSADSGTAANLYSGTSPGVTPVDIDNLGATGTPLTATSSLCVPLAYTQDTEDIVVGGYATTVTYSATLVP